MFKNSEISGDIERPSGLSLYVSEKFETMVNW